MGNNSRSAWMSVKEMNKKKRRVENQWFKVTFSMTIWIMSTVVKQLQKWPITEFSNIEKQTFISNVVAGTSTWVYEVEQLQFLLWKMKLMKMPVIFVSITIGCISRFPSKPCNRAPPPPPTKKPKNQTPPPPLRPIQSNYTSYLRGRKNFFGARKTHKP